MTSVDWSTPEHGQSKHGGVAGMEAAATAAFVIAREDGP
jgi:hypothetical protein